MTQPRSGQSRTTSPPPLHVRERFLPTQADADARFPVGGHVAITKAESEILRYGQLDQAAVALRARRWLAAQPDRTHIRTYFSLSVFMMNAWKRLDMHGTTVYDEAQPVLV